MTYQEAIWMKPQAFNDDSIETLNYFIFENNQIHILVFPKKQYLTFDSNCLHWMKFQIVCW